MSVNMFIMVNQSTRRNIHFFTSIYLFIYLLLKELQYQLQHGAGGCCYKPVAKSALKRLTKVIGTDSSDLSEQISLHTGAV